MKNSSLASQLIVFILTSAALIFLAASTYSYYASKEGIIRRARESAQHLTRETVYQIEVILRGVGEDSAESGGQPGTCAV